MPVVTTSLANALRRSERHDGLTREQVTVSFATTQLDNTADQTLVYLFPDNAWLWDLSIYVPTELDSDATPALTLNVGVGDVDGVIDTTLISASAAGQADATRDDLDATVPRFTSVGGKYLIVDVGTAADVAVAGTIVFSIVYDKVLDAKSGS